MSLYRIIMKVALFFMAASVTSVALAEDWPTKPVRIIVPFSAGGSTDAIARYLANKMESIVGKSVVVQNVTGGGTVIGMRQIATGDSDGSNMILTGSSSITVMKHTMSDLPLDPESELAPITFVNTLPHWIVVRSDHPEKTFEGFVNYIRKNPGEVSISVNAIGGAAHLALANWAKTNNLDILIVPYRGSSAAMVDVIGGSITAHVDVIGSSLQLVKAGKARALAVLQEQSISDLPDVPASPPESAGGLVIYGQHVLAVKSDTPKNIINKIYDVTKKISLDSDFVKFIKELGFEPYFPDPEESQKILNEQSRIYADLVRATNIKIN